MKLEEVIEKIAKNGEFEGLIEYNKEIKTRNIRECPFLTRLENQKRVSTTQKTRIQGKIGKSTAQIIREVEEIPKPEGYVEIEASMLPFTHRLEIPDLSRHPEEVREYLEQEIPRGIMEIRKAKEKAIIQGVREFKGLEEIIPKSMKFTINTNENSKKLRDEIDEKIIEAIDKGASPTIALSNWKVGKEISKEMKKEDTHKAIEVIPNLETINLKKYNIGQPLPLIISKHVPGNTIYLLDEYNLYIKDFFKEENPEPEKKMPIFYKKLARTKLTRSRCLVHYSTFYVIAPEEQAKIDISFSQRQ